MSGEVKATEPQWEDRESGAEGTETPEHTPEESGQQKPDLLSLDDLFDGAQGSSCSIDGTCD